MRRRPSLGGRLLAIGAAGGVHASAADEHRRAGAHRAHVAARSSLTTEPRVEPDLDLALSEPVEDSVYPQVGDPGVDALHYDLDLTWLPERRRLDGGDHGHLPRDP